MIMTMTVAKATAMTMTMLMIMKMMKPYLKGLCRAILGNFSTGQNGRRIN